MKNLDAEGVSLTLKIGILVFLCVQNASHALMIRYSQGILKETYSSYEVVLTAEFIKLVISGYLATTDSSETDAQGKGFSKLIWLLLHSKKIIVLVVLYGISNILAYYALARLDASIYTVLMQLKTLTTPAFAVLLLNRNISSTKWRALLLLVLGCILVASPTYNPPIDCAHPEKNKKKTGNISTSQQLSGIFCILTMVTISGYSAIYFEGMLKKAGERITIWERNYQLAFYSIVFMAMMLSIENSNFVSLFYIKEQAEKAVELYIPFQNWTINAVLIAIIQAVGGLLVAATLKYADAILKTLATCGSIVLSTIVGYFLLGGQVDLYVGIGCITTILAIVNYTFE